jgi:hypothetical protein
MKVLVIICSRDMDPKYLPNFTILNDYLISNNTDISVDYAGVLSTDDFDSYESVITFKYKLINPKQQFTKISDFINKYKHELNYDWYIKFRPELKLLEPIDFSVLSNSAINARARLYRGPKKIKNGLCLSACYDGPYKNCFFEEIESEVIIDDVIYIFDQNVINQGAFNYVDISGCENEWIHTKIWKEFRHINLNIIGINAVVMKHGHCSADINM